MGLETGTYISDLVSTNPVGSDLESQGDDHLRLIKTLSKNTFPNASKPFYFPGGQAKSAAYSIVAADQNDLFVVDTTSAVTLTLPSLVSGDAGWSCYALKSTADANALTIAPPSGTINGAANVSTTTRYDSFWIIWSGTEFFAIRLNIASGSLTYSKIQNVSATDKLLGRSTAGAGVIEEIACTAAGRALLDDADAAAQRATLSLGTMALEVAANYPTLAAGNSFTGANILNNSAGVLARNTVKAFGQFVTNGAGVPTLQANSFNVASVANATISGSTGFRVTFSTALSGTTYVFMFQAHNTSGGIIGKTNVTQTTGYAEFIARGTNLFGVVTADMTGHFEILESA